MELTSVKSFSGLRVKDVMTRRVVSVKPEQKIRELFKQEYLHSMPVIENGKKLLGMIDHKRLMNSKTDFETAQVKSFAVKPPFFNRQDLLVDVAPKLVDSEFRAVPVVEEEKVKGILSLQDIACAIALSPEFKDYTAGSVMSEGPVVVGADDAVDSVVALFRTKKISRAPVLDEKGDLVGIVSFSDIVSKVWHPAQRMKGQGDKAGEKQGMFKIQVKSIMTSPPVVVKRTALLREIHDKTHQFDVSDVVVVDGRKPAGIITLRDIVRLVSELAFFKKPDFVVAGIELDWDQREFLQRDVDRLLKKQIRPLEPIKFHVREYKTGGQRTKYAVKASVATGFGTFRVEAVEWELTTAFNQASDKLEKIILNAKERNR